jgi:hypothetical protein
MTIPASVVGSGLPSSAAPAQLEPKNTVPMEASQIKAYKACIDNIVSQPLGGRERWQSAIGALI